MVSMSYDLNNWRRRQTQETFLLMHMLVHTLIRKKTHLLYDENKRNACVSVYLQIMV